MNKTLLGLILGVLAGGAGMWFISHHDDDAPAHAPKPAEKPNEAGEGLKLSKEAIAAAGVKLARATRVSLPPEIRAYGRVLDPTPFVNAVAEVATAEATLAASEKDFQRVRSLHEQGENASTQALETSEATVQRDRIQLLAARSRLAAAWGPVLATKAGPAMLQEMQQQQWALVRIDAPAGETPAAPPVAARVGALIPAGQLAEVELLGRAPTADAQLQGASYLAIWRGQPLPVGAMLSASLTLPGKARKGFSLPRSALVRHEGSVWIYQQEKTSFERRRVELGQPLADSFVITAGVDDDDDVVVVGAQQLLSAELQGAAHHDADDH